MARYIDADKLIAHLEDEIRECKPPQGGRAGGKSIAYGTMLGLKSAIAFADALATADVAPRIDVAREVLAKVDDLAWRHKMRGHVSMDLFHDDIEELKQKYTEDQK